MPETTNFGAFAQVLAQLTAAMQPGMTRLTPVLLGFLFVLVLLEVLCIVTAIVFFHASVAAQLIRFVVRTLVLIACQQGAPALLSLIVLGFTELGLLAGNQTITVAQFMDPGNWLSMGLTTAGPILAAWNRTGVLSLGDGLMYLGFWVVLVAAFVYMGFSLFVLQLQMGLAVVGAQVLLPTAVSRFLSWMARGVIAYPINMAFRFFFKAFLAGLTFTLLSQRAQTARQLTLTGAMSQQAESMLVICILPVVFAVLFWKSDSIAAGLLQGLPGLTPGSFVQAAAGGLAVATGVGGMAVVGTRVAGAAGGLALRAGAGAHTAYQLGSATAVGGRMTQLAGGLQGVLTASGQALRSVLTARTAPAMAQVRQTLRQGSRAGFVHSGGTLPSTRTSRPVWGGGGPPGRPGPGFTTHLRQTLQQSAYYFGSEHSAGGVTPP